MVLEEYFGADDEPVRLPETARVVSTYDAYGNRLEARGFDRAGGETYEERRTFDERNLARVTLRYRRGERAVFPGTNAHEIRHAYDAYGREVRQTYFDLNHRPTRGPSPRRELCGEWVVVDYDSDDQPKGECRAAIPRSEQ